jgi:hypothetical protein
MLVETLLFEPGLRNRSAAKRAVALAMVEDRQHCRETWVASGFSVEFALKALICRKSGWDSWPSAQANPEAHTHSLKKLFAMAGINLPSLPREMKPSVRQILDWERRHDYIATPMARKVARSMFDAAFAETGVVEWLNKQ